MPFLLSAYPLACSPANQTETAASPVIGVTRRVELPQGERGTGYDRRGDDGTVVAKLVAPASLVWEALLAALTERNVKGEILDRAAGRAGDTALVMMRQWNGQPLSRFLDCGSTMTGPRADQDRVRAILLAQLSHLSADTIAVAVHFSANARSLQSGSSGTQLTCTSTGQAEKSLLDDILRRATAR